MDAHLSQLMFLDEQRKTLDHHIVLWNFDESGLDHKALKKLDNAKVSSAGRDSSDDSDDDLVANKMLVEKLNATSSCCTVF